MTKYKCGCKTDGIIILDDNIISMVAYLEWSNSVGLNGTKEQCWDCWNKELSQENANTGVSDGN